MVEAKTPENITESFINMINYYGKFVPYLYDKLRPLQDATRKSKFKWTNTEEKAFKLIKKEIASPQNLADFEPDQKIKLVRDAAKKGIRAVLLHIYENIEKRPLRLHLECCVSQKKIIA